MKEEAERTEPIHADATEIQASEVPDLCSTECSDGWCPGVRTRGKFCGRYKRYFEENNLQPPEDYFKT